MATPPPLRLLGSTNNDRGDLFTRLTSDLFFALGYDDLRFDIHKSGREVDVQGRHRLFPRRLVAECKAHADKIGGDDLNKFFGVLYRERGKDKQTPVDGIFVSLNGFRETCIEQENETDPQERVALLTGQQVVAELIRAGIILDETNAADRAGKCCAQTELQGAILDGTELVGCSLGYVWVVYYSQNKLRTHFALIHADGTPLDEAISRDVIQEDRKCKGTLHKLKLLSPPQSAPERAAVAQAAIDRYRRWIVQECGEIQLDGLPADADLSAFRMRLERLFVPLKVMQKETDAPKQQEESVVEQLKSRSKAIAVGDFLDQHSRFSILAKPGGGKSTLLKRIAVAYADPIRRKESDDGLPDRDWLPLLLRCRELRDRAHRPIIELLEDLTRHAALNEAEAPLFRERVNSALRTGRAILLIDGLDEISAEGTRTIFANHLRSFLAMFPGVAIVITSREAGYRQVAGVVATVCEQVRLAAFDEADVTRLCEAWHTVVVNTSEAVRGESRKLAKVIWQNDRIRALAENPLMLTTLLVVRRCVGDLPTRRGELYFEAVKVLIRTWNTEGFEPMDLDETLAQLSYVAFVMMNEGIQRIGKRRLLRLLHEARIELAAELQFTKVSPTDFIDRVEYRSSLLMQTGYERIDEELQAIYEFRHLTFQEYLAARGLVEEQYPGRESARPLVELVEPYFDDVNWREVIPLAAVLAGRKADPLIQRLTEICQGRTLARGFSALEDINYLPAVLLRQSILDEVQISPTTLKAALRQMARLGGDDRLAGSIIDIRRGRFGEVFHDLVKESYLGGQDNWTEFAGAFCDIALYETGLDIAKEPVDELAEALNSSLTTNDRAMQAMTAMVAMSLAFHQLRPGLEHRVRERVYLAWEPIRHMLISLLTPTDPQRALAATWALVWIGASRVNSTLPDQSLIHSLYQLWRFADSALLRDLSAWAIGVQPLLPRDTFHPDIWGDSDEWLLTCMNQDRHQRQGALVVGWYRRRPWSDAEISRKISEEQRGGWAGPTSEELLVNLGSLVDAASSP